MARKTDGEKVDELVRLTAILEAKLEALEELFKGVAEQHSELDQELRAIKPGIAVIGRSFRRVA